MQIDLALLKIFSFDSLTSFGLPVDPEVLRSKNKSLWISSWDFRFVNLKLSFSVELKIANGL